MPEADDLLSPHDRGPRGTDVPWRDWHGHIVVCGLDDVGMRVGRAAAAVRRAGRRRRRRPRTAPAALRARVRRRPPAADGRRRLDARAGARRHGAAAMHLRRAVGPGEPRGRAARQAAAAATCGSSMQLGNPALGRAVGQGHRPGQRAGRRGHRRADPRRGAAWTCARRPIDIAGAAVRAAASSSARSDGTLRELFGDLAPIAVGARPTAAEMHVCPGRDLRRRRGRPRLRHRHRRRHATARRARPPSRTPAPPPAAPPGRHRCAATSAASSPRPSGRCG